MRRIGLTTLAALLPALALADSPKVVEVPRGDPASWSEVKAAPGRILRLSAEPASKWTLVDDEAADLLVCDGGKYGDFAAPATGRYKLIVTGPDGAAARVLVVVGNPPPNPKPPGPNPPDPPKPPADPLREKVAKAFADDPEVDQPKKKASAKLLAELYRQLAKDVVPDPAVTSPTALLAAAQKVAGVLLKDASPLLGVRRIVGEELAGVYPVEADITDDQRAATAKLFARLAAILDTLGA